MCGIKMKKTLFVLLFLFLCVVGGVLASKAVFSPPTRLLPVASTTSQQAAQKTPNIEEPVGLIIPSLSVNTEVERVGLDSSGRIDIPKNVYNVGWYSIGFKPGESGNAVIDGHFDTPTGAPSVFYALKSLNPGDQVIIEDAGGKKLTFLVEDVVSYNLESVPMGKIVEKSVDKRLNLITCGGAWDATRKIYNERVVAYTKLFSTKDSMGN